MKKKAVSASEETIKPMSPEKSSSHAPGGSSDLMALPSIEAAK